MNYTPLSAFDACIGPLHTALSFPRLAAVCFGLGLLVTQIQPSDPCSGQTARTDRAGLVCVEEAVPDSISLSFD